MILKATNLRQLEYLKKESDQPIEGELPTGFAISLYHVIFMYATNITVVSKFTREIVFSQNFKDERVLRGIQLDIKNN